MWRRCYQEHNITEPLYFQCHQNSQIRILPVSVVAKLPPENAVLWEAMYEKKAIKCMQASTLHTTSQRSSRQCQIANPYTSQRKYSASTWINTRCIIPLEPGGLLTAWCNVRGKVSVQQDTQGPTHTIQDIGRNDDPMVKKKSQRYARTSWYLCFTTFLMELDKWRQHGQKGGCTSPQVTYLASFIPPISPISWLSLLSYYLNGCKCESFIPNLVR